MIFLLLTRPKLISFWGENVTNKVHEKVSVIAIANEINNENIIIKKCTIHGTS